MNSTLPNKMGNVCGTNTTNIGELGYKEALARGKVQVLRLASLDDNGDIIVQSVKCPINDETFQDVGICSYTWGFDRVKWFDKETGLTWDIASRCEAMCRAALKFYPRVWIDGLCMIQAWSDHIGDNMKIMGRLYWHGNVVPEMILDKMAPEYPLRGWVQQEISFTNLQYCITPLQNWFDDNHEIVQEFSSYIKKKKELKGSDKEEEIEYPATEFDILPFDKAVSDSIIFFNVLSRAAEGRENNQAVELKKKIAELMSKLQAAAFMSGSFYADTLENILSLEIDLTGNLKREENPQGLNSGAIQSFRTGFFRYNTDREVAAFSLAAYVSGEEDTSTFMSELGKGFVPNQRVAVTINGNPGRWCTGLSPIASIKTAEWPKAFHGVLRTGDMEVCQSRDELDLFVSILHGCAKENICENYDYVVGFRRLEEVGLDSCHIGLKRKGNPDAFVYGLVSANIPIDSEDNKNPYYTSYGHIVNKHIKMELGMRAISLLNSSWHVQSANDPKMVFPTDSQTLRMLDLPVAPPFGPFTSPMKRAILNVMYALGCSASTARDPMKLNVDLVPANWGDEDMKHTCL